MFNCPTTYLLDHSIDRQCRSMEISIFLWLNVGTSSIELSTCPLVDTLRDWDERRNYTLDFDLKYLLYNTDLMWRLIIIWQKRLFVRFICLTVYQIFVGHLRPQFGNYLGWLVGWVLLISTIVGPLMSNPVYEY